MVVKPLVAKKNFRHRGQRQPDGGKQRTVMVVTGRTAKQSYSHHIDICLDILGIIIT